MIITYKDIYVSIIKLRLNGGKNWNKVKTENINFRPKTVTDSLICATIGASSHSSVFYIYESEQWLDYKLGSLTPSWVWLMTNICAKRSIYRPLLCFKLNFNLFYSSDREMLVNCMLLTKNPVCTFWCLLHLSIWLIVFNFNKYFPLTIYLLIL